MAYTKPQIVAQNNVSGSYAAGCPEFNRGPGGSSTNGKPNDCLACERTR